MTTTTIKSPDQLNYKEACARLCEILTSTHNGWTYDYIDRGGYFKSIMLQCETLSEAAFTAAKYAIGEERDELLELADTVDSAEDENY